MVKDKALLAGSGLILAVLLFIFGRTTEPKKPVPVSVAAAPTFDIEQLIEKSTAQLPLQQAIYVDSLKKLLQSTGTPSEQSNIASQLANFWGDSVRQFDAYVFYLSKQAKLDNSEKNLTFAGQLILTRLRGENDEAKLAWQANEAIGLFEKAIALNPANEDLKIALGSCYIFGKGRNGDPQETMKGIQELLAVVRRDSLNMKAQLMLGIGGFVSGQYDKAIARLTTVVKNEPGNVEAIAFLADTYAAKGDKAEAIRWYDESKKMVDNPAYSKEVDERIKQLQ
ncbi:MAG: tetratricopeptide repeat protein [Sphingobacteriales bacterium]|nr:tetratricopeptide repeat protein [Sphingobacteriales bacterium]